MCGGTSVVTTRLWGRQAPLATTGVIPPCKSAIQPTSNTVDEETFPFQVVRKTFHFLISFFWLLSTFICAYWFYVTSLWNRQHLWLLNIFFLTLQRDSPEGGGTAGLGNLPQAIRKEGCWKAYMVVWLPIVYISNKTRVRILHCVNIDEHRQYSMPWLTCLYNHVFLTGPVRTVMKGQFEWIQLLVQ